MAKTARKESEEVASVKAPDFDKALRIITHDVKPAEEKSAAERGKLSGAWKAVEDDAHCNKPAAKLVAKLMAMSEETKDDFLRTQYGLMRAAGLGISRDLVDLSEGVEHNFPVEGDGKTGDDDNRGLTQEQKDFEAGKLDPVAKAPAQVKGVAGISGGNLPPELQKMADAGAAKPAGRKPAQKPKLVTVN